MQEIRLYALTCGIITADKSVFIAGYPKGERIPTPICSWLVVHPRGNVVFDTGAHPDAGKEPSSWGGLTKAFTPNIAPDNVIVAQLSKVGYRPDDIAIVVNSHLHMDHAGGNQFFPKATFYVQAEELDAARDPEMDGKGYFRADWDHGLDYRPISGDLDLFGDHSIEMVRTPGHTPGHQSLIVRLPKSGTVLLAGDACDLVENMRDRVIGRVHSDGEAMLRALDRLASIVEAEHALFVPSHDGDFWNTRVKHPPEYYG